MNILDRLSLNESEELTAPADETSATASIELEWKPDTLQDSLIMTGKGMMGVFVVIGAISLMIFIMNKLFKGKRGKAECTDTMHAQNPPRISSAGFAQQKNKKDRFSRSSPSF